MQRWNMSVKIATSHKWPVCCQTSMELAARSGATIKIHMMGKKMPGGVQPGMMRSPNPPVASPFAALLMSGRELSKGEKRRERMLMPKKRTNTAQDGAPSGSHAVAASSPRKKAATVVSWMTTAPAYFNNASESTSLS
eukprot:4192926-Amphidinium_carterae.1